jgi:hypothetical protein
VNDVHTWRRENINPHCARRFALAAANIKNLRHDWQILTDDRKSVARKAVAR